MSHIEPADIERVIEAAGRLFAEKGYDGVGMREISEASGVKTSSIFYHFGSKSVLFAEVVENRYKGIIDMVRRAIKSLHEPEQKMECILGTLFDALLRDPVSLRLLQRDITNAVADYRVAALQEKESGFISLGANVLEAAFENPEDRSLAFSLGYLIVGLCGLSAVMPKVDSAGPLDDWYVAQRDELISTLVSFGRRMRQT